MDVKIYFAGTAIILGILSFVPYLLSIHKGETRPHVFSWVIWGTTTLIVFFAQVADKAGMGAWPTGVSASLTIYIALLAYKKRGDISITRLDYWFGSCALMALPVWFLTEDPVWAVVLLTIIDTLAFAPTFLKSYHQPYSEHLSLYYLTIGKYSLSILALENYSITTLLFPFAITLSSSVFIIMIYSRRYALKHSQMK